MCVGDSSVDRATEAINDGKTIEISRPAYPDAAEHNPSARQIYLAWEGIPLTRVEEYRASGVNRFDDIAVR